MAKTRRTESNRSNCLIGTSGWSYPDWKGAFYPENLPQRRFLEYYAGQFNSVEINNTFYGLPKAAMLKNWCESIPSGFCFAIKASRYISHVKRLSLSEDGKPNGADRFFQAIEPLGGHIGPILFQLPPHWHFNPQRLEEFLAALPSGYRYAFELRDPDWLCEEAYAILQAANAAYCIYDLKGFQAPVEITADFAYLRFHGPRQKPYVGSYGKAWMSAWSERIRDWNHDGIDVYCYFNNTDDGSATKDAYKLQKRVLGERMASVS